MPNLIAGSAKPENIDASIKKLIPLARIETQCSSDEFNKLKNTYPDGSFSCWALSNSPKYKSSFSHIKYGDYIVLKPNGQKK